MHIIALYTLNYYEDKYLISLFASFKHRVKIYAHISLKININITHYYIHA